MDFSKFSDDNFDVKEWVNSALRIRDDRTPIDVSCGKHCSEVVRTRGTTTKYIEMIPHFPRFQFHRKKPYLKLAIAFKYLKTLSLHIPLVLNLLRIIFLLFNGDQ